ncbi:MAG: hypothetical protein CDV28_10442 [Candidatus Electronema aureum]|uniref:Uncharacterized protein n=1 Tax=Candidatus Electronema aureum TaxID=2005002 RepID=A0A521G4A7_9BACT|nr:MAG: hypothetical protein CDV28_10442 [Candidatus Electronema aureum]
MTHTHRVEKVRFKAKLCLKIEFEPLKSQRYDWAGFVRERLKLGEGGYKGGGEGFPCPRVVPGRGMMLVELLLR